MVDVASTPVDLEVVLGAGGETFAAPVRTLRSLPGSDNLQAALWAQTLRVDPGDYGGHLDLAQVDSVQVRTVSDGGRIWLLDASRREPGLASVPDTSLPVVHLGRVVQPEGSATTGGTALLPFTRERRRGAARPVRGRRRAVDLGLAAAPAVRDRRARARAGVRHRPGALPGRRRSTTSAAVTQRVHGIAKRGVDDE